MRILTREGRRQAIGLMEQLAGMRFDEVIVSTAVRAKLTAGLIVGNDYSSRIHEIESMYGSLNATDHRELLKMFEDLGYSRPLADYFSHRHNPALRRLSAECALDIKEELGGTVDNETILFVGHPVLLNGLIYFMFDEGEIKTLALTHVLGECGAIRVNTNGHGDADAKVVERVKIDSRVEAIVN